MLITFYFMLCWIYVCFLLTPEEQEGCHWTPHKLWYSGCYTDLLLVLFLKLHKALVYIFQKVMTGV